jgi:4-hydroxy-2-oxoheptanedioate aldolase
VAAAHEIASVPGIDGVYIGQADLALSLGLKPLVEIQRGVHEEAIRTICKACDDAGITRGINGDPVAMRAAGYRLLTIGSDMSIMNNGVQQLRERSAKARENRDR